MSKSLSISIWLIILPAIISIIFTIYFIIYKIRINKAIKNDNTRHIPMPSVGSIGSTLVIMCLIIFMIVNYVKLSNIQDNINSLEQNFINKTSHLQGYIEMLEDEIESSNSIINSFEYEIEAFDLDNHTMDISFAVIPKNYSDNTTLTLTLDDNVITLTKSSANTFIGSLNIDFFSNKCFEPILVISDNNNSKSEILSDIDMSLIWQKFLPSFNAFFANGEDCYYNDNEYHLNGTIDIVTFNQPESYFVHAKLAIELNGTLLDTQSLSIDNGALQNPVELDKTISMKETDNLEVYIIADDSSGYTHKYYIYGWTDNSVQLIQKDEQEKIYDSNGTLLTK